VELGTPRSRDRQPGNSDLIRERPDFRLAAIEAFNSFRLLSKNDVLLLDSVIITF
jgi:hypothetical protein